MISKSIKILSYLLLLSASLSACHWVSTISHSGELLEIEDGSQWHINPSHQSITQRWRPNDTLVISPTSNPFSPYDLFISNKTLGTYVEAKHSEVAPLAFGPHTRWIVDKSSTGLIVLNNGTVWTVHPLDQYLLAHWLKNDMIITGSSDTWLTSYDSVLINMSRSGRVLSYARAKLYQ